MPKDNCDCRVHLMLVSHANSLGLLSNLRVASLYKFFHDQADDKSSSDPSTNMSFPSYLCPAGTDSNLHIWSL